MLQGFFYLLGIQNINLNFIFAEITLSFKHEQNQSSKSSSGARR